MSVLKQIGVGVAIFVIIGLVFNVYFGIFCSLYNVLLLERGQRVITFNEYTKVEFGEHPEYTTRDGKKFSIVMVEFGEEQ